MLYLYGGNGHGKVVLEIAEKLKIPIGGFIDSNVNINDIYGYNVEHLISPKVESLFISIGNNNIRKKIFTTFNSLFYPILISPSANVSVRTFFGNGTVVMSGATVNVNSSIGFHCIINTNSSVDHDCEIGDFSHISPNAALAGNVKVGEGTHIGIGACIIQGVKIGKWVTIGAGAVIIQDIPDYAVVVGNPGKIIKFNKI